MKNGTLAQRLGTAANISPLLMKARRLGLLTPEDFEKLAVRRGLGYYDYLGDSSVIRDEPKSQSGNPCGSLSAEEFSVALASLSFPYSQLRLRMAAAVLATRGNLPERLARLARRERCEAVIVHIGAGMNTSKEPAAPTRWKSGLVCKEKTPRDTEKTEQKKRVLVWRRRPQKMA